MEPSPSCLPKLPPIILVGLGNPILGDDGVGWTIAAQVRAQLQQQASPPPMVDIECLSLGGLSLMERLIGYERAILIDAVTLQPSSPGKLHVLPLDQLPDPAIGHLGSSHDTSLQTAIRLGRSLGASLPSEILVVGIEISPIQDFSEQLSPPVSAAVPGAVQMILHLLNQLGYIHPKEVK